MSQDFVQVSFDRIVQTRAYTAIVFKTKECRFAIYTDEKVGQFLQSHLSGDERTRPSSHDLFSSILNAYAIDVKQIRITHMEDTVFYARLFLEKKEGSLHHIVEIDARPSDCIIFAFLHNVPVFCAQSVLQKAVPFAE